jgi:hypothetical protein
MRQLGAQNAGPLDHACEGRHGLFVDDRWLSFPRLPNFRQAVASHDREEAARHGTSKRAQAARAIVPDMGGQKGMEPLPFAGLDSSGSTNRKSSRSCRQPRPGEMRQLRQI